MVVAELIERYAAGPRKLREAVAGMNAEQAAARPIVGRWSTLEVVSHLADFEIIGVDRLTSVIAEHEPTLPGRSEQHYAERLGYQQRDLEEQLRMVEVCRSHATTMLKKLSPDDWKRRGMHTEAGPLTLEKLLERVVKHVEHHIPFILEKRAALKV